MSCVERVKTLTLLPRKQLWRLACKNVLQQLWIYGFKLWATSPNLESL